MPQPRRSSLALAALAVLLPGGACSLLAEPCDAEHACPDGKVCSTDNLCVAGEAPVDDAGARADAGFDDDAGVADEDDAGFPDEDDAGFPADAGFADAGFADAGFADAGFADAGFLDAGGDDDAGFADAGTDGGETLFVDLEPNLDGGPFGPADGGVYESRCADGADAGSGCDTDCSKFFWGLLQDDGISCTVMQPAPARGTCDVDGDCLLDADALDACAELGPGLVLATCDATCAKPGPLCVRGPATSFFGVGDLCVLDAPSDVCQGDRCVEDEGLGLTSELRCNDRGMCGVRATGTCGDYLCADEFTCADTCQDASDCVGAAPCDGGTCITF